MSDYDPEKDGIPTVSKVIFAMMMLLFFIVIAAYIGVGAHYWVPLFK